MIRENCKDCEITLMGYEKEEFEELCLDCYREANNLKKSVPMIVPTRMKNKKLFFRTVQPN
jgi:hypothetical protein